MQETGFRLSSALPALEEIGALDRTVIMRAFNRIELVSDHLREEVLDLLAAVMGWLSEHTGSSALDGS